MSRNVRVEATILAVVLSFAAIPAFAGSAIIGSVAGTMNATIGGQPLVDKATVFSGDYLNVKDGAAVIALNNGSRLTLGQNTQAFLLRDDAGVTVLLDQGEVSLYQEDHGSPVRVKVGSISVLPDKGYKTLGEVAMMGDGIVVTAKRGSFRVEGKGAPVQVGTGKSILIKDRAARAPQTGTMQKLSGGGSTALEAGALGAGVAAAILAGIGLKRAGDAKDAANAANATAGQALSAANKADSDAIAATSAATDAANLANLAGCALNNFNDQLGTGLPSPYTPPTGYTCPFVPISM